MSGVKAHLLKVELHRKLRGWSVEEDGGIPGVEVKFVDIRRNTGGEGGHLDGN